MSESSAGLNFNNFGTTFTSMQHDSATIMSLVCLLLSRPQDGVGDLATSLKLSFKTQDKVSHSG